MTERFKHSEFQQDDGQYQYYGIEDTFTHYVYNVIGEGMYDVSEKQIIKLLNELHNKYIDEYTLRETLQMELQRVEEENKELKKQVNDLQFNKSIGQREYQRRLSE